MLISKTIKIKWTKRNIDWYKGKGYNFTKYGDICEIRVLDLTIGSHVSVEVECDNPDCENPYPKLVLWQNYLRSVKNDGSYYCNKCAKKLYGTENTRKTKLKDSISFKDWCIKNNHQDVLDKWDYELNSYNPEEISFSSHKKYWFKCPKGLHKSELKRIDNFVHNNGVVCCRQCNSFAQWGIDNICTDFLDKYWDYEKNNKLNLNPWELSKNSNKKVWIRCQGHDYHDSYYCVIDSFKSKNSRCPYCDKHGKIHPLDSLGKLLEDKGLLYLWLDKNKKSPYEYAQHSGKEVWWKCPEGKHEDYLRRINDSNTCDFRCPECGYSKGEEKISNHLIKNNISYIPQKEFDGLLGLGGGNLSYDFYLPQYNLLIEYQGEQHEKYIRGFHKSEKDFQKQQEHDRRKREYAKEHNVKLLEIWYWDFDNIETILNKI